MNAPKDFRYISEDRRRAMLDRRAKARGDRRSVHYPRLTINDPTLLFVATQQEQESVADELRRSGMVVR